MDAGLLNKRITLMQFEEFKNEIGYIEQRLVEYKKVWANIKSINKGGEYLENKKIQQRLIYRITIRNVKSINQSMFIKYKDIVFNIKDITGKDLNNPYITLFCEERDDENERF